ncbi:proline dehydrogenase family protein [Bdellovibrionota bacterium FG-2]
MFKQLLSKALPFVPKDLVHAFAKKYVAGETLEDGLKVVEDLNSKNIWATMDLLGEFVSDRRRAEEATQAALNNLDALHKRQLRSGISTKLTSQGLDIDDDFCYTNLKKLVEKAKTVDRFVRIDMENSPYTSRTLNQYRKLRAEGFENTGIVLQAYMRRSEEDLKSLLALKPAVRLCKGIYREDAAIAFKGREEIQDNYKKLLTYIFDNEFHAAIATHDDVLIDFARALISKKGVAKDRYEFQMLLGVRDSKRDELVKEGHKVRVYVPYGDDWYGYSIRRLKENPEMAAHILKAIVSRE